MSGNKNGPLNEVATLEAELGVAGVPRQSALRKLESKLTRKSSTFASRFVSSPLLACVVDVLGAEDGGEAAAAAALLARGCTYHVLVLDAVVTGFFEDVVLHLRELPDLEAVLDAMSRHTRWVRKLREDEHAMRHLANHRLFGVLGRIPEQAVAFGAVSVCMQIVQDIGVVREAPARLEQALRCLTELSFFADARADAIAQGAVGDALRILGSNVATLEMHAGAAGCLRNLLQDPSHEAKVAAFEGGAVPALLLALKLDVGEAPSKTHKDVALFALQALEVLASHAKARAALQDTDLTPLMMLAASPSAIVARTSQHALDAIAWTP